MKSRIAAFFVPNFVDESPFSPEALIEVESRTVRLWSRCRSVLKTREFRFDYLTHMVDGIEKMSFVCWHFLASRILAEI